MTIQKFIENTVQELTAAGIETARLDCLVLLEDALHTDRTQLLAHDDRVLTSEQLKQLAQAVRRRAKHEPLAYIRGKSEFFGHVFKVNADTLEPRPETETLVSMFLNWHNNSPISSLRAVDVGTGSGAIAIAVKLAQPEIEVIGTELNPETIKVAMQNSKALHANVQMLSGDLLEPVATSESTTVLLCNLPYVPDGHTINQAAMQEPSMAIFGGADGLDLYRKLFKQINTLTNKPVAVFTEALPFQHHGLAVIARQYGYVQEDKQGFIQQFVLSD